MSRLHPLALAAILAAVVSVGCGSGDPNKDLKPIDPNTKPPKAVKGEGPAGDKPAKLVD